MDRHNTISPYRRAVLALGLTLVLQAAAADKPPAAPPLRIILVGDSTMTAKAGYGKALCGHFTAQVDCVIRARSGRGSGSYRAEKDWDEVQRLIRDGSGATPTYVLVQFGHNDLGGSARHRSDLATEFPVNMARYAREIRALGGTPVLVTPLVRRMFENGIVTDSLADWAAATRRAAAETDTLLLDLHRLSSAAIQPMGQAGADTLGPVKREPAPLPAGTPPASGQAESDRFDRTHLNAKGAQVFAAIVAAELARLVPAVKPYVEP